MNIIQELESELSPRYSYVERGRVIITRRMMRKEWDTFASIFLTRLKHRGSAVEGDF